MKINLHEHWQRSLVKAITYRVFIVILDFSVIWFFTKSTNVAASFVVISNIYTTFGYYIHERVWNKINWGKNIPL